MTTPADELRTAAKTLREHAQDATPGPWRQHDTHLDLGGHTATVLSGKGNETELRAWLPTMSHEPWDETRNAWANASYMALMDPRVGHALADWLDHHANILTAATQYDPDSNLARPALKVARALNGDAR
ncbi:hypothetical protein [Streptomyces sp. NPDC058667]|uniref:hypothetical protein n=1 Tax=Streptomyces sp. NPDC058667 TaxID=3346588 RepID=UPI003669E96A